MTLVDSLHREIATTLGLRPQPEWEAAIHAAIHACSAPESASEELRARILADVAARITVPETHFFRNHAQLSACADHLVRVAREQNRLAELWVAGCATGEEPYSVAMLVDRQASHALSERLLITASDINPQAIKKAQDATYTSWSFRGAPGWCFSYFEAKAKGQVTLRAQPIRDVVKFEIESCQRGAHFRVSASLDAISFRNVAIYLEESATRELHREFARLLRPGGLLVLGPSDPRPTDSRLEFVDYFDDAPVYRRAASSTVERKQAPPSSFRPSLPQLNLPSRTSKPRARSNDVRVRMVGPVALEFERTNPAAPSADPTDKRAIDVVRELADDAPADAIALRILGQMHLSRGEANKASEVLRRAVFLDGTDVLSRYFYALALRETGELKQAMKQLNNVTSELSRRNSDDLLSDQSTKVADLLCAARFLEEQWA